MRSCLDVTAATVQQQLLHHNVLQPSSLPRVKRARPDLSAPVCPHATASQPQATPSPPRNLQPTSWQDSFVETGSSWNCHFQGMYPDVTILQPSRPVIYPIPYPVPYGMWCLAANRQSIPRRPARLCTLPQPLHVRHVCGSAGAPRLPSLPAPAGALQHPTPSPSTQARAAEGGNPTPSSDPTPLLVLPVPGL